MLTIRLSRSVLLLGPAITLLAIMAPSYLVAQTFEDVAVSHWAFDYIEALVASGISGGCGGGKYCPDANVSRAQMAVFLGRGIRGSEFTPPPASGNILLDVGVDTFGASYIEQLYLDGITGGVDLTVCGQR